MNFLFPISKTFDEHKNNNNHFISNILKQQPKSIVAYYTDIAIKTAMLSQK